MNFFRAISNLLRFDRTNWKALALCFFAAAVFWLFNAFNKDYATNISFPVQFDYDNTKYVAAAPLPPKLTLNVSGNGWDLFRKRLGLKVPVISLTLERPTEVRKIPGTALSPFVASQVGSLQLNYIVTDTIRLKIEPKTSKTIRLKANVDGLSFKKDFGRTGLITIFPDTVRLEGPRSFIDSLRDTISLKVPGSRISENYRESIEVVVDNNEYISRNPPVAEVTFEVGPIEEVTVPVKLRMPKAPLGAEIDNDSVSCVFSIPTKEHTRFLSESTLLVAAVDLGEMKKGETKTLLPTVKGMPEYAALVRVDSVKIKKY